MKKTFFKNNFAQGTIEYLVIIAVIVVIGLVVVSIATDLFDSQNISSKNDKLKNKIGQGGITILDSLISESGDGVISIKNTSGETLTLQKISTANNDLTYNNKLIVSGNTTIFSLEDLDIDCPCNGA